MYRSHICAIVVAMLGVETITLELATDEDAVALASISERAFETDVDYGSPFSDGPHGYASPAWQRDMMHRACAYWKVMSGTSLIGGMIVFHKQRGRFHLARLYIDPAVHRRGYGRQALRLVLAAYPEARRWTLETPIWSWRAQQFYAACGFRPLRQRDDMLVYEMVVDDTVLS